MQKSKHTSKLPQIAIPQPTPSWLQNFTPLLQQARCFINNDQDKEALKLALAEHKNQPSLDTLEIAFDSYLALKKFELAKEIINEMKKLGATEVFLNLQKTNYYIVTEKFAQAQRYLKKALLHKNQLDNRHRSHLYFMQGMLGFFKKKPETFPFTQALRYDYLLMPVECGINYLMRGLIRLEKGAYEASYQDAQNSLYAYPKDDFAYYLRVMAGYNSGHWTHLQQDIQKVSQSKNKIISKDMKSNMRQIQKALPKEPLIIDKDFVNNLHHRFFDEVDDMINASENLTECLAAWTGPNFENKMKNSIKKSMEYLLETFSKLNKPDLPEKLKEIKDYLQLCVSKDFTKACLDLNTPKTPSATSEQLDAWRTQILLIMDKYDEIYTALVDKLEDLRVLYHIPVFVEQKNNS